MIPVEIIGLLYITFVLTGTVWLTSEKWLAAHGALMSPSATVEMGVFVCFRYIHTKMEHGANS